MPKKIDPELKVRAVRLVNEHQQEYLGKRLDGQQHHHHHCLELQALQFQLHQEQ